MHVSLHKTNEMFLIECGDKLRTRTHSPSVQLLSANLRSFIKFTM